MSEFLYSSETPDRDTGRHQLIWAYTYADFFGGRRPEQSVSPGRFHLPNMVSVSSVSSKFGSRSERDQPAPHRASKLGLRTPKINPLAADRRSRSAHSCSHASQSGEQQQVLHGFHQVRVGFVSVSSVSRKKFLRPRWRAGSQSVAYVRRFFPRASA
jgi:hypothetical protein